MTGLYLCTRIVTGNETRIHYVTPSTKKQIMAWKQADKPAPKKAKLEKPQKRLMCTTFWDHQDEIYTKYLCVDRKDGHTVTKERHIETLYNLCEAIKRKRPGFLSSRVIIFHGNAKAYISGMTLANFGWIIFTHPPYRLGPTLLQPVPSAENMVRNATVYERC